MAKLPGPYDYLIGTVRPPCRHPFLEQGEIQGRMCEGVANDESTRVSRAREAVMGAAAGSADRGPGGCDRPGGRRDHLRDRSAHPQRRRAWAGPHARACPVRLAEPVLRRADIVEGAGITVGALAVDLTEEPRGQ